MNDIRPKNPLRWIKYRYLEWKWDRILKRSGYKSWESYFRANDPDYFAPGRTVREQLVGYPYIVVVPFKYYETVFDPLWGPVDHGESIDNWCKQYCKKKYRWHWERVIMDHQGQYLPNGISGYDELFFGFKDYNDYITFKMTWS